MVFSQAWEELNLADHNHRHKCPRCEEIRWHHGTKATCDESNQCSSCEAEQIENEFYHDIGNAQDIGGIR